MYANIYLTRIADSHESVVGKEGRVEQANVQETHRLDEMGLLAVLRAVDLDELVSERLERRSVHRIDHSLGFARVEQPHDVVVVLDAFAEDAADC